MNLIVMLGVFFFLAVVVLFIMGVGVYNSLVSLRNQVDRAWANIDVILKQRFDEIPQLVQVVEQFAQYEKATIGRVMDARAKYGAAQNTAQKVQATQEFGLALRGVIAIGEAYPELRSNQSFIQLQSRVSQLESDIADRREVFNEAVTNLNTRIQQFPDLFFAGLLNYRRMELLQSTTTAVERSAPSLKMNLG